MDEANPQKREPLTEAEINAIAKQVAKNLKDKHLIGIGAGLSKSLKKSDWVPLGKGLAKSPLIIVLALVAISLACIAIYKAVPDMAKEKFQTVFNQEITNAIKVQFAEPRISNVVVAVARVEASNLMQNAVQPEIAKFQTSLNQTMNDWPSNLFSRTVFERIKANDTNLCAIREITNGLMDAMVKLQFEPVPGSLQGSIYSGDLGGLVPPKTLSYPISTTKNVMVNRLAGEWHLDTTVFEVRYVREINQTNIFKTIGVKGKYWLLDGEIAQETN